jgi:tetratricopeptide (TPR) repeat protein
MTRLARLPHFERTARHEPEEGRKPRLRTRYYAFLSYSHKDKELADWLHSELEKFRVPKALAGKLTANGVVPRRLTPIFRDQHDLSAGDDLAVEIEAALAASQFLVVLCSPTAATSRWTNLEIESFKRTRPEGCVLAAIVGGEPFASDVAGREDEECFPPALRYKYDRRGHRTTKRAEPLAADFREGGDGRRVAFLKLVAGMLGVGLDELVQRETTRRQRRLALLAAASLGGMAVTSTLAVTAMQARDAAREQRREAEGLIGFMLGDLKDKLEPIGRLDALDGVGTRVLSYYQKEGTSDLSDAALSQRSRALSLMAEVATKRGDVDGALRLYREAMAGTGEAIARQPEDPQRLFDHAQNVFYVGEIAQLRGDFKTSERYMREYQSLASRMVAIAPDNMKWRMEVQYADADLGAVLYAQRQFAEAAVRFQEALNTIEAISTADPSNEDYRKSVAESLAWLADARRALGQYDAAIAARQRDVALLEALYARTNDVDYRQRLMPARRALGGLYEDRGDLPAAIGQYRQAIADSDALTAIEPDNAQWLEYGYQARLDLANALLASKQPGPAAAQTNLVCQTVRGLLNRDSTNPVLRKGLVSCVMTKARLALSSAAKDDAAKLADQAVSTAGSIKTGDKVADGFFLAAAYRLRGDIARGLGDPNAARGFWTNALSAIPPGAPEQPYEISDRMKVLARLGRAQEAGALASKLQLMGYRGIDQ